MRAKSEEFLNRARGADAHIEAPRTKTLSVAVYPQVHGPIGCWPDQLVDAIMAAIEEFQQATGHAYAIVHSECFDAEPARPPGVSERYWLQNRYFCRVGLRRADTIKTDTDALLVDLDGRPLTRH